MPPPRAEDRQASPSDRRARGQAAHKKPHGTTLRARLRRPSRLKFLAGWVAVTAGTIVVSSLALQAALTSDRGHRPVSAPQGALDLTQTIGASPSMSPSTSPSDAPVRSTRAPAKTVPTVTAASPSPVTRRTTARARPRVRISSPDEQAKVQGEKGVLLTGTATGLGNRTLHIFDLADNGSYYPGSLAPVAVRGGRWSFHKRPIGRGSADVGHTFVLIAVLGDADCRAALRSPPVNPEGDYAFPALPDGCREMDSVQVIKSAP